MTERTFQKDGFEIRVARYQKDDGKIDAFVTVRADDQDVHTDSYDFDIDDDWAAARAIQNAQHNYWKHLTEDRQTLENNATSMALMALKAIILLNGAAAIALFAFLSPVWADQGKIPTSYLPIAHALELLVRGVFVGLGSTLLGYLVLFVRSFCQQQFIANMSQKKFMRCARFDLAMHSTAIMFGLYAYYCFGAAAWSVHSALFVDSEQAASTCAGAWTILVVGGIAVIATAIAVWAAMRKQDV